MSKSTLEWLNGTAGIFVSSFLVFRHILSSWPTIRNIKPHQAAFNVKARRRPATGPAVVPDGSLF